MSDKYSKYIYNHRLNVKKGLVWMLENIPNTLFNLFDLELSSQMRRPQMELIKFALNDIIGNHDLSKFSDKEYTAYDEYFYGNTDGHECLEDFNHAWLHHIHANPHHWQYWVLNNDDPNEGEVILDMPIYYIIEMVCDWWSFSWDKNNLSEIFDFYESRKDYIKLSEKTRKNVEFLLNGIKNKLEEMKEYD